MIRLEGLSALQRELAQHIWEIQDHDELIKFVRCLPRSVAVEAHTVIQMILIAQIEEEDLGDMAEAKAAIDRVRSC